MFPEERGMRGDINPRLPVAREGTSESLWQEATTVLEG